MDILIREICYFMLGYVVGAVGTWFFNTHIIPKPETRYRIDGDPTDLWEWSNHVGLVHPCPQCSRHKTEWCKLCTDGDKFMNEERRKKYNRRANADRWIR